MPDIILKISKEMNVAIIYDIHMLYFNLITIILYGAVTQCVQLEMGVPSMHPFLWIQFLYPPIQSRVPSGIGFSLTRFIYGQL